MSINIDRVKLLDVLNVVGEVKAKLPPVTEASYIVYEEGGTYYAKNGRTGQIEFSGTDASEVIQRAIDALGDRGGRVFLKSGGYVLTKPIVMRSRVRLEGEEMQATELVVSGDFPAIKIEGSSPADVDRVIRVTVSGILITGTGTGYPNCHGITVVNANEVKVLDVTIYNCRAGVYMKNVWQAYLYRLLLDHNHIGIFVDYPSEGYVNALNIAHVQIAGSESHGALLRGISGCKVYGLEVLRSGSDGIHIGGGVWNEFVSVLVDMNNGVGLYMNIGDPPFDYLKGFRFIDLWSGSNGNSGVVVENGLWIDFIGGQVEANKYAGIVLRNCQACKVIGMTISGNSRELSGAHSGILLSGTSTKNIIAFNKCSPSGGFNHKYNIEEYEAPDYNIIVYNDVSEGYQLGAIQRIANTIVRNNFGYRTENSGVATILAGTTRVTVPHGLASAPTKVLITPYGNIRVWVENITSISFDVVTDEAPTTDVQVAWYAEV